MVQRYKKYPKWPKKCANNLVEYEIIRNNLKELDSEDRKTCKIKNK
jgi:hypothetical protein